jgi:hypothetical protein
VSRSVLERKLSELTTRLRALREEIRIADEQLLSLAEDADDARLRALVSETPLAEHEHAEAQKHADAMQRHLAALRTELAELERSQDDLLDRLIAQSR